MPESNLFENTDEQFDWDGDTVIRLKEPAPCYICGKLTHYISISFYRPLCSKAHLNELWDMYNKQKE